MHEYGDCSSADAASAGGHYAPEHEPHGLPSDPESARHAGDLGNIEAGADGRAAVDKKAEDISLAQMENPVLGRGIIVHAERDDGGQPTGNAGARIACGTIAMAEPG